MKKKINWIKVDKYEYNGYYGRYKCRQYLFFRIWYREEWQNWGMNSSITLKGCGVETGVRLNKQKAEIMLNQFLKDMGI